MRGRRFLPIHTYSLLGFSTIPSGFNNQDYSCTYPLRIEHAGMVEKGRDNDKERDQGQPTTRVSPEKVDKEVKKIRGTSHPKKFEAIASDKHHRDYILLLFVGLAHRSTLCLFSFFFLGDFRIMSHLSFACKWQNRFWDGEIVVARFPSNKGGTLDIRIPCSSLELHPAPCMRDVCCVRGLGLSCTSKQNVLSLILLIPLAKLMNQKRGIYGHCIL